MKIDQYYHRVQYAKRRKFASNQEFYANFANSNDNFLQNVPLSWYIDLDTDRWKVNFKLNKKRITTYTQK